MYFLKVTFFMGEMQGWNPSISCTESINEHELVSINNNIYVYTLTETLLLKQIFFKAQYLKIYLFFLKGIFSIRLNFKINIKI